jgi:N-acetylneuraminate synthase
MGKYIEIAGRKIGVDYDPVVIAEMGINPGGSLEVAKAMVDSAYEAGIEIIKHQTHAPEEEIDPSLTDEMNTFTEEQELELKLYVESKGMIFISAPYCFTAVNRLERMNVAAYKISSTQISNTSLIEYVASKEKPIILSAAIEDLDCLKISRLYHVL